MSHDQHFDRVIAAYGPALGRLASAYERDQHDREDLLQDILFALWRALPSFRGQCSERTFIYRVAHNRALTYRRRARPRGERLEDVADVSDSRADPAERAVAVQRREHLLDAIRRLSPGYRQVVTLRLEDLSNAEIAEVLGVSENTVAIRLTRARKALADLMHEEWSNV